MRVGVDIRWLQEAIANRALGGIGRYALNLTARLRGRVELVLFASPRLPLPAELGSAVRQSTLETAAVTNCWRLPGRRLGLASVVAVIRDGRSVRRAAREARVDLVHLLHQLSPPPRGLPCPSVVTVHDLAYLRRPELFFGVPAAPRLYRWRLQCLRRATKLIAVSQATAQDLTDLLRVHPSRIEVIGEAADPVFSPLGSGPEGGTAYFLHVGGAGPSKNLKTLIEAGRLLHQLRDDSPSLVIVGVRPGDVSSGGLEGLKALPYLTDEQLAVYYRGAVALVYPSVVEGFGLPVLEAMACGTPVITSSTTSTAEIADDAGLLLRDPSDARELARLMLRVWDDSALRCELSRRGLARARRFNWDDTVDRTVGLYGAALRGQ